MVVLGGWAVSCEQGTLVVRLLSFLKQALACHPHGLLDMKDTHSWSHSPSAGPAAEGYLAHKKMPPPRTLQKAYAKGPMVVLRRWRFLMNEIPL